jgi:plastocyanin
MAAPLDDLSWRNLFHTSVVGLLLVLVGASIFLIQGVELALLIFIGVLLVGLVLSIRAPGWGDVVLFIAVTLFTLANLQFTIPSLLSVKSTAEFILAALFFISGITAVMSGIAVLRHMASSDQPRNWFFRAIGLIVLLSAIAVVIRVTSTQDVARRGDSQVVAEDIAFTPVVLEEKAGRMAIFVDNKDLQSHTFTIDDLGVDVDLPGASQTRFTFKAKAGTYVFRCTISGHDDMTGTLAVR